ncbi:hypothetical protein C5746_12965 [Streptomyces atratus]|uniref:Uncharacterized protein n=1 Tax=Streptomyces atratus TaxID=1893 RepID=A0A2Z5JQQ6_STRAR|nr:hypothetical protein C5746_12965 [Streptomyces atratus]
MYRPPSCPHCPDHPALWRDTSRTTPTTAERWDWYCAGCRAKWEPTLEQKAKLSYGTPRRPRHGL